MHLGLLENCKIKLADFPEMNYHSKTLLNDQSSPTGEVCIYGPKLFSGYFKNKSITAESFDSDWWLQTGDVGRIVPENKGLKIIDRKKDIFKLCQDEHIAPRKLESVYMNSKFVSSICIYGNSLKSYLIAIIVPKKEYIFEIFKKQRKNH